MNRGFEGKRVKNKTPMSIGDLQKLLDVVKTVRYGSVTLIIQDGHWIQLDINEKMRLKTS